MKTSDSTVTILAPAAKVWRALTVPDLVKQWQYGSDLQEIPEHHFFMMYELTERDGQTSLLFRQEDPRPSPPTAASGEDAGPDVLAVLKELVEVKMR